MASIDIELEFTDITMAETDGIYDEVKEKMLEDSPFVKKWMIKTDLIISSQFGEGFMTVHFYSDKDVVIVQYNPSNKDVYYNPDVRALSTWAKDNGWNTPHPYKDLILDNKDFWRYFWETYIIDSEYFDKIYGKRDL